MSTGAPNESDVSIENARYNLFKKVEEVQLDPSNSLFKKTSRELSGVDHINYTNYCKLLIDTEKQISETEQLKLETEQLKLETEQLKLETERLKRESQQESQQESQRESYLSELMQNLSRDQYNMAKCLPLNVLKPDFKCSRDNFLTYFGSTYEKSIINDFYTRFFNLKN